MGAHYLTAAALLFAGLGSASAGIQLTAEKAAAMAREKNPELLAARNLIAEAEARAGTSGRLSNPELETEVAGGKDSEGRISVGLTQRFPLTARLRLERELSDFEIEAAKCEVQNRERLLTIAARTAFYGLAAARESLTIAQRQTELAEAFALSLSSAASQGFASKLDAEEAALAADRLRMVEDTLRVAEIEAAARLSGLLAVPADTPFSIAALAELPATVPPARKVGTRADLELAELAARAGATEISLARATRWDDVGIGLFVEGERFRDEPEGIEPEALVGIRFNVPLPFWQSGSGKVAEKKAAQERKTRQLGALQLSVQNEALTAHRVMAANHRAAALIRGKILPTARQLAADAQAAHGRAEVDAQSVFRARERLAGIELSEVEARQKFFLSHSEWLGSLGEPVAKP